MAKKSQSREWSRSVLEEYERHLLSNVWYFTEHPLNYGSQYALSAKKMASLRNTPTQRLTKIMAAETVFSLPVPRKFAEKFHLGCTPTKCCNWSLFTEYVVTIIKGGGAAAAAAAAQRRPRKLGRQCDGHPTGLWRLSCATSKRRENE